MSRVRWNLNFDIQQCLLGAHLHGKKFSNPLHRRVTDDDLSHDSNARAVGSLSDEESSGLPAQEQCDQGEKDSDKDRRNRIEERIIEKSGQRYSKEREEGSYESG